jgi:hypothetical protein
VLIPLHIPLEASLHSLDDRHDLLVVLEVPDKAHQGLGVNLVGMPDGVKFAIEGPFMLWILRK